MKRFRAILRGAVQGVGFRPFVRRVALAHRIAGLVRNERRGVRVDAQGDETSLDAFLRAIAADGPGGRAVVCELEERPVRPGNTFVIEPSEARGTAAMTPPPDLAPCPSCLAEVAGTGRRRRYPFTSCTRCGPRWSVATGAPWDRVRTTMAPFVPCAECAREHDSIDDHRAHAQTIACPRCGPRLWLDDSAGVRIAHGDGALRAAVDGLGAGRIVALKGVGGWQLLVDATREDAVAELRRRKQREARPFAVLFADIDSVRRAAVVGDDERTALEGTSAPIVLLHARSAEGGSLLAPSVAPTSRLVGAMLPSSPLHALLAQDAGRPLVCTSGNLADEPLCIDDGDARRRLAPLCHLRLGHDRAVARPLDDSVVRVTARGPIFLRRARGLAPRVLPRHEPGPVVLALGAHLKATVALALADEIWLSAHIGDLGSPEAIDRLAHTAREMLAWANVTPDVVACDLHPDLASTLLAERLARETGAALARVPHHAAHVAAVAAEHAIDGPLLGFAWDGMGLGEDGMLWGGESIVLEGPRARRAAHLRPFPLPGGEAAIREPRRAALGLLAAAGLPLDGAATWFSPTELVTLRSALSQGVNAPLTTSIGRLFDAVAAIAGLRGRSRFEAEAAMELEQAAMPDGPSDPYPTRLAPGDPIAIDWGPLIAALLEDRRAGASVPRIAARFHASLADAAGAVARRIGVHDVALAGGCFQNALLVTSVAGRLDELGHAVWLPRELPPGDGGLAVGQAVLAARRFTDVSRGSR